MSRDKKIAITPAKLKQIKVEAVSQAMILHAAYLMDELDYSDEKILEVWDGVARYADAIKHHDITLNKVCKIINEHTGLNIRWNG